MSKNYLLVFGAIAASFVFSLTSQAKSLDRECTGRFEDGRKLTLELIGSSYIQAFGRIYGVDKRKETKDGFLIKSSDHGGVIVRVRADLKKIKGEFEKFGKFKAKCSKAGEADAIESYESETPGDYNIGSEFST